MLVFALQFSRCARHDVEAKTLEPVARFERQCLPHVTAAEASHCWPASCWAWRDDSLKMEEKTRAADQPMVKR